MRTEEFKLGGIANDFRHSFLDLLSSKARKNSWHSSNVNVSTNKEQKALYFSHSIQHDTEIVIERVDRDIQESLQSMRNLGFQFDVKTIKKGYEIQVTNIK
ncbi:MAG: hypothetical protein WC141_09385 [Arcobacteraceae bacterium]